MNNINIAFFLAFIAGFSTLVGLVFIFLKIKEEHIIICSSLAFASGVMLSISIFDLIPSAIRLLYNYNILYVFLFMVIGICLSSAIDYFIGSDDSLYKVGIISMIGIIMHNIPEGILTFITCTKDIKLGVSLAIVIAIHNIPEGISIGIPIFYSTNSKIKTFSYTFIAAFSELLGAIITYLFLINYINNFILGILFSVIAGIMIQISLLELLPVANSYNNKLLVRIFFIFGFVLMIVNLLF